MKKILFILVLVVSFSSIANAWINPESVKQFIGHKITVTTDFGEGIYIMTLEEVSDTELIGKPRGLQQKIIIPIDRVQAVEEMADNFI